MIKVITSNTSDLSLFLKLSLKDQCDVNLIRHLGRLHPTLAVFSAEENFPLFLCSAQVKITVLLIMRGYVTAYFNLTIFTDFF